MKKAIAFLSSSIFLFQFVLIANAETDKAEKIFEEAKSHYYEFEFEEAQTLFEQCLKEEPDSPKYKCWLAQTLAFQLGERNKKGESKLSLIPDGRRLWKLLESAYKENPESERARVGFAVLLRDVPAIMGGDLDRAEELLLSVYEDNPQNIFANFNLGKLYLNERDDIPTAMHYFKNVVRIAEERELNKEEEMRISIAYNALGDIFIDHLNQPEIGVEYLQKAVELSSDDVKDMLALTRGYVELNNREKAKATLLDAVKIIEERQYKEFFDEAREFAKKLNISDEVKL